MLFKKIQNASYKIPPWFSPEARALLEKILVVDPVKRATVEAISTDPWFIV